MILHNIFMIHFTLLFFPLRYNIEWKDALCFRKPLQLSLNIMALDILVK